MKLAQKNCKGYIYTLCNYFFWNFKIFIIFLVSQITIELGLMKE